MYTDEERYPDNTIVQIMADGRGGKSGNLEPGVWNDYARGPRHEAIREARRLMESGDYQDTQAVDWITREVIWSYSEWVKSEFDNNVQGL